MKSWTGSGGLACSQLCSLASPLLRCVLITEARPPTLRRSPSIDFHVPSRRIDKQLQLRGGSGGIFGVFQLMRLAFQQRRRGRGIDWVVWANAAEQRKLFR